MKRGDAVTLIGGELNRRRGRSPRRTIGYEILTNLGSRYARTYRGGEG